MTGDAAFLGFLSRKLFCRSIVTGGLFVASLSAPELRRASVVVGLK
jgi:hypothetical protein